MADKITYDSAPWHNSWGVWENVERDTGVKSHELLASFTRNGHSELFAELLRRGWARADLDLVPRAFDSKTGADIDLDMFDAGGNNVDGIADTARVAAMRAAEFVILHGSDPDENGKDAQRGRIEFSPVRRTPEKRDAFDEADLVDLIATLLKAHAQFNHTHIESVSFDSDNHDGEAIITLKDGRELVLRSNDLEFVEVAEDAEEEDS